MPVLENPGRLPVSAPSRSSTKRSARQETGLLSCWRAAGASREALRYRAGRSSRSCSRRPRRSSGTPICRDAADGCRPRGALRDRGRSLDAMADTVTPQGVVAVARQSPTVGAGHLRRLAATHRDLRGGARPRQPRHDHPAPRMRPAPTAWCSPGRDRRPVQPEGRARRRPDRSSTVPDRRSAPTSPTVVEPRPRGRASGARRRRRRRTTSSRRAPTGVLAAPTAWLFGNEARGLPTRHPSLWADRVAAAAHLRTRRVAQPARPPASRLPATRRAFAQRARPTGERSAPPVTARQRRCPE